MVELLKTLDALSKRRGPVILCIMDGMAIGPVYAGNAFANAHTPNLKWFQENCPGLLLKAHGTAVGMPSDADMGNSEVGHNAIGCGRVFAQGASLVNKAIETGALFEGETWKKLIRNCRDNRSTLHFIGLLSDGNVHSHVAHLQQLIAAANEAGIKRIRVHILLDGRDVGETSALEYVEPFEEFLAEFNRQGADYRIASGGGRMTITMDRYEADWGMVEKGWNTHVRGVGRQFASAAEAIKTFRNEATVIDQYLPPFVIADSGKPVGQVVDHDSVILFNFRGDRSIELCKAFESEDFDKFDRGAKPDVEFAGMMEYDSDLRVPKHYLVDPPELNRTIGEYLVRAGVRQLAISETQKFGHVTYFFNGNRSGKFDEKFEDYVEIPSDRIPFDERPWMKAAEITGRVMDAATSGQYQFIRVNYPNGDMVGHTGHYLAAVIACETVDLMLGRLKPVVSKVGGVLIVTADHGNADEMYDWDKKTGKIRTENNKPKAKTSHTLNPVPCYIYDPDSQNEYRLTDRDDLGIASLAATCLNFLGFRAPEDFEPSVVEFPRR